MPPEYRRRKLTIPFTDGKGLPHSITEAKLQVANRICRRTGDIPYERAGQPANAALLRHDVALYINKLRSWIRSTRAMGSPLDEWYDRAPAMREYVSDLLSDAAERDFFDQTAVNSLRDDYLDREASLDPVGAITTIEAWLQQVVD